MRSSLGKHVGESRMNTEEKAAARDRAYEEYGVCVIDLNPLDAMDRAIVERIFLDQKAAYKRDLPAESNIRSIR